MTYVKRYVSASVTDLRANKRRLSRR